MKPAAYIDDNDRLRAGTLPNDPEEDMVPMNEPPPLPSFTETWPPALVKACTDSFSYALGLRTGQTIWFESAAVANSEWVTLFLVEDWLTETKNQGVPLCPRGIDVRMADIMWVADAPDGT